jgi:hypothetical protein
LKTAIIVGTRPEIIKLSPVIRECEGGAGVFYPTHGPADITQEGPGEGKVRSRRGQSGILRRMGTGTMRGRLRVC